MSVRISVTLSDGAHLALIRRASEERRSVAGTAALLLEQALGAEPDSGTVGNGQSGSAAGTADADGVRPPAGPAADAAVRHTGTRPQTAGSFRGPDPKPGGKR